MALLDLLGRRQALRILWELREGPEGFRALRARCGDISPSVLTVRLGELEAAGIVERGEGGWTLSAAGAELGRSLQDLAAWAAPRGPALRRAVHPRRGR
jgi:DNA-binding HxlR family transcriptional regulator